MITDKKSQMIAGVKTILIVNLGGIGDIILSTPALRALKAAYPKARILFLAVPRAREFLRKLDFIDEVFTLRLDWLGGIAHNTRTSFSLRRRTVDCAINMRTIVSKVAAFKIRCIFGIIRPKTSVGRNTDGRGYFFDIKVPETTVGDKHEMEYDIDTVTALGATVSDRTIDMTVDDTSSKKVEALLKDRGMAEGDVLIAINPGGKPSHRWPAERFIEVMERLNGEGNNFFAVTGAEDEKEIAAGIAKRAHVRAANLAGDLSLEELTALIRRSRLFVSNDTAPIHIAAALKTPLVAIFGPGYITRFDPRHIFQEARVLYKKTGCAPCNRIWCAPRRCLEEICVEEVVTVSLEALHKTGVGR